MMYVYNRRRIEYFVRVGNEVMLSWFGKFELNLEEELLLGRQNQSWASWLDPKSV